MAEHTENITTDELIAHYELPDRSVPNVRANFISSLDGAATQDGRAGGLGNADDQRLMGVLRMLSDVVLVGAGTLRVEGYGSLGQSAEHRAWRVERGLPGDPTLAVVSGQLHLDATSRPFADAPVRPIVFTLASAPEKRRAALAEVADVIDCGDDQFDPHLMLSHLTDRGLRHVLCEGGPHLFGTMVAEGCIDELCLTLSPVIENGPSLRITAGSPQTPHWMRLVHAIPAGDLLLLRYQRAR